MKNKKLNSLYESNTTQEFRKDDSLEQPDKFQAPTPSENVLKPLLYRALEARGLNLQISHQEVLIVSVGSLKRILKKFEKLHLLSPKIIREKFLLFRPDFLCVKYGFAIEVDGDVHHNNPNRFDRDELKDYAYYALGIKCFRVANDQLYNTHRFNFVSDVLNWCAFVDNDSAQKRKYAQRRINISKSRAKYRKQKKHSNLIGQFNQHSPRKAPYPNLPMETSIQFSGYRTKIQPKK